jgi:RNA polymerase sigma-70 factor (ECF subfamily)
MEPNPGNSVIQHDEGKAGHAVERSVEMVDLELVRRTKSGDVQAFEELFNRYQKRVYNLVYRILSDENDAADLTQEVFVRVFHSIGRLRAEEAFFTWLKTVTVNVCRDYMRRRPPRTESLDATMQIDDGDIQRDIADQSAGPEKILLSQDRQRMVQKAVSSLSDDHRLVVVLHHIDGMDVSDIAKMLGSPVGTIKSRLARARDELKRKLGAYVEVD